MFYYLLILESAFNLTLAYIQITVKRINLNLAGQIFATLRRIQRVDELEQL